MARQFAGRKQGKVWTVLAGISQSMTANATFLGGTFNSSVPFTVLRMLGEYIIAPTDGGTFVAGDAAGITVGIGVVSTDAVGAGALPDPASEPEYPWLYWASHVVFLVDNSIASQVGLAGSVRANYDIKTMRKVSPRQSLKVSVDYSDLTGTPPLTVVLGQTRVLLGH